MQHILKNILRTSLPRLRKSESKFKPFTIVIFEQQRWLAQRISTPTNIQQINAKRMKSNDQNVTPLGWFLLLIPITTFGLGCWQVKRKAWKEQLIKELEQQTRLDPVALPDNWKQLSDMEYSKVKVTGKFLHDKEMLMGPRSLILPNESERAGGLFSQRDTGNGYLVITPFQLSNTGEIILVNRGWISRKQMHPSSRQEGQINDEIDLVGVVRKGETRPQFTPDHKSDVFLYRDLDKMCSSTGAKPVFLDATYEMTVPGGPIGGQTRVGLRNEHLSYLITWFSLSAATSYMWYRQILKRLPF